MRRNVVGVIGVVAVLAAIAIVWWVRRTHGERDAAVTGGSGDASGGAPRAHGDPHADEVSASGRVTRAADGVGIAGATVVLARQHSRTGEDEASDDDPTIVVTTDARGAWTAPHVKPGSYLPSASAAAFVPAARGVVAIAAGAQVAGLDIKLAAGGVIVRGTVSDIGGGPIADARVTVQSADDKSFMTESAHYAAITGADGTYQLALADGNWFADVTQPEYLDARRSIELAGKPLTVDFKLTPGGSIRGQVVTRQGVPVPGARVAAHSLASGRMAMPVRFDHAITTADDSGHFVLRPVESGALELEAVARGVASSSGTSVALGIGEQLDNVRVVVDRAFAITGTVVDKDGHGVAGIRVNAFSFAGASAMSLVPSSATGAFEIVGVRPASYMIAAMGDDTMPEMGKSVEVSDKDITGVTITVGAGSTLTGVVDPPQVASLVVEIDPAKVGFGNMFDSMKAMLARADSDATGAFVIHHAPPGEFVLTATTKDGHHGRLAITIAGDRAGLVVPLEARASIAGRVVDPSGAPVAGASVESVAPKGGGAIEVRTMGGRASATTAADGTFKLVGLDVGTAHVRVSDEQGTLAWADAAHRDKPTEAIAIEVPTPTEVAGVTLTVEARDGVIRGQVVDATHQPIADAWITSSPVADDSDMRAMMMELERGRQPPVLTGSDGRFVIEHLRHTAYRVTAESPLAGHASNDKVNAGDDITLVLATLGSLAGTVTAGGAPVTVYDLECKTASGRASTHVTGADGTYHLDRLVAGSYECVVDADAGPAIGKVDVTTTVAHLDFTLGPWASVTGTIVDANGAPMPGLAVAASSGSARSMADLIGGKGPVTDASGHFLLTKLAPGKASFAALSTTGGFKPIVSRELELTLGQQLDLGTLSANLAPAAPTAPTPPGAAP